MISMGGTLRGRGVMGDVRPARAASWSSWLMVALLACSAGCEQGERSDSVSGLSSALRFAPTLASEAVYRVQQTGHTTLDYALLGHGIGDSVDYQNQPATMRTHQFEVSTTLHSRVLSEGESGRTLVMRLQNHQSSVDGVADTRTTAFETPFLVTVAKTGEIQAFRFTFGFPSDVAAAIQGLVEPLQVVFEGEPEKSEWVSQEQSSLGSSAVRYRVLESADDVITLDRQLLSTQRSTASFDTGSADLAQRESRINKSSGTVAWAADGSGLNRFEMTEDVSTMAYGREALRHVQDVTAQRIDVPLAELPSTLDEAETALRDLTFAKARLYEVPFNLQAELRDATMQSVLLDFERGFDTEVAKVASRLKYFVRTRPEAALDVTRHFDALELTPQNIDRIGRAYAVLGAAGHPEAQSAMVEALRSPSFNAVSRDMAARGTMSVALPEPELVRAVWDYRNSLQGLTAAGLTQRGMITNIYGALGGVEHGLPENTREVVSQLRNRLSNTTSMLETAQLITALGNVGDLEQVLPITRDFFHHEDIALRARAFHTFQKAEGDEAFAKFAHYYELENNIEVRRVASAIAKVMLPSATRNNWAQAQAIVETDGLIRGRLVTMIGEDIKNFPENEATLRQMLETVRDREIRKTIYRYISPVTQGGAL